MSGNGVTIIQGDGGESGEKATPKSSSSSKETSRDLADKLDKQQKNIEWINFFIIGVVIVIFVTFIGLVIDEVRENKILENSYEYQIENNKKINELEKQLLEISITEKSSKRLWTPLKR